MSRDRIKTLIITTRKIVNVFFNDREQTKRLKAGLILFFSGLKVDFNKL